MVGVFRVEMAMHSSPKDLGRVLGFQGLFSDNPDWIVFSSSKMNCRTLIWLVCAVCVITKGE